MKIERRTTMIYKIKSKDRMKIKKTKEIYKIKVKLG